MPGHSVHQGLLVLKMAVYGRLAHPQFLRQLAETGILVKSAAPHTESRLDNLRICHFLSTQAGKVSDRSVTLFTANKVLSRGRIVSLPQVRYTSKKMKLKLRDRNTQGSGKMRGALALFCGILALGLPACARKQKQAGQNRYEEDAIRLEESITFYNDYLGFSYTIPKGWWLYDLNSANFSRDQEDTADAATLDIEYEDGYTRIGLASFANFRFSSKDRHLGFEMAAEFREDSNSIEKYMPHFEESMLKNDGEAVYSLLESGSSYIAGRNFEKRVYGLTRPKASCKLITISIGVKEGYFLNIIANYWPGNKNAEFAIIDAIDKAVVFDIE
jgi:hypothetical protein